MQQSGAMGYALYITLFVLASLCLLPGSVLVLAAGMVFGPWLGTLLSLIAATVASALSFLLARGLGRALVLKYVGHTRTFQAIERGIAHSGIDFLILTRLIPLFPYNIQNYAYGLTSMPFWSRATSSIPRTRPRRRSATGTGSSSRRAGAGRGSGLWPSPATTTRRRASRRRAKSSPRST